MSSIFPFQILCSVGQIPLNVMNMPNLIHSHVAVPCLKQMCVLSIKFGERQVQRSAQLRSFSRLSGRNRRYFLLKGQSPMIHNSVSDSGCRTITDGSCKF